MPWSSETLKVWGKKLIIYITSEKHKICEMYFFITILNLYVFILQRSNVNGRSRHKNHCLFIYLFIYEKKLYKMK